MEPNSAALGETLRAWRDRLTPEAAGLPRRRGRRSVGLRREDVAELAGISVDYVVRLEQGRAVTPSAQVVRSLACALRLSGDERDHLHRLAGMQPPGAGQVVDQVPAGTRRVLARMEDIPVAVFAADWSLVWWNQRWSALFGDPSQLIPEARNLVRLRFPVAEDRGRLASWPVVPDDAEASDRALVADLRRASVRFSEDERLMGLIARTRAGNPRFAAFWADASVGRHNGNRKTVKHPVVGDVVVDCDVLTEADTDLKVLAYTAVPGGRDEERLARIGVG